MTATTTKTDPAVWELPATDDEAARHLAAAVPCLPAIAALLATRGIDTAEAARAFFTPTLDHLHDPLLLLGMDAAVARIQHAVAEGQAILIYGDYDVDGTTATVLLKTAIERIAPASTPARVTYHVPHRIREGYGMQTGVLDAAALAGVQLVISVDTGIRAFAAADQARALNLDLIVTDHHLPDQALGNPHALSVINPAQPGCSYPFKSLCGAAVAFKLAHALLAAAAATDADHQRLRNVLLPSFLKLVAIATIADSVPLVGENRAIAALGLAALANPVQPGLRALMTVADIPFNQPPSATEVGFRLAPRINAAGRMDIADDVVELFLTRSPERAQALAEKLNRLNEDRRATEAQALAAIEQSLARLRSPSGELAAECIVLDDPTWHRGVLGILASRIVDRTHRPALVVSHEVLSNGETQAHGSGRSIEGFHLLDALTAVNRTDDDAAELFSRFGGHAHAVGFSLPSANLALLRQRLSAYASTRLTTQVLAPRLHCDLALSLADITPELYHALMRAAPFGIGNPEPVFVTRAAVLAEDPRLLQQRHLCLRLQRSGTTDLKAIGWSRAIDWADRSTRLALRAGISVDIAYRLRWNSYGASGSVELELCALECTTQ